MVITRQDLEAREADTLAPYAVLSAESGGRFYPEEEPLYRTAFQRDRDRILHSAAFRRLEYKTQVFMSEDGDYSRTRMTHTLEVAQVGRTIARALAVNEDLVEAICLAHDLGHPPFGHAGERALDAALASYGGFNHNLQGYRLVTELEQRYTGWPGLNLTRETLFGMAKHETDYALSEAAGLDPASRGSLEAQIADISDELAYSAHDLDDGLNAGILDPVLLKEVTLWQRVLEEQPLANGRLSEVDRHTLIRAVVGLMVDDLIRATDARIAAAAPRSADDVRRLPENLASFSAEMGEQVAELKRYLFANLYGSWRIVRMQRRAERFLTELVQLFLDDPRQLPPAATKAAEGVGLPRAVGDTVASMTDRGALLEYRRLFDPAQSP